MTVSNATPPECPSDEDLELLDDIPVVRMGEVAFRHQSQSEKTAVLIGTAIRKDSDISDEIFAYFARVPESNGTYHVYTFTKEKGQINRAVYTGTGSWFGIVKHRYPVQLLPGETTRDKAAAWRCMCNAICEGRDMEFVKILVRNLHKQSETTTTVTNTPREKSKKRLKPARRGRSAKRAKSSSLRKRSLARTSTNFDQNLKEDDDPDYSESRTSTRRELPMRGATRRRLDEARTEDILQLEIQQSEAQQSRSTNHRRKDTQQPTKDLPPSVSSIRDRIRAPMLKTEAMMDPSDDDDSGVTIEENPPPRELFDEQERRRRTTRETRPDGSGTISFGDALASLKEHGMESMLKNVDFTSNGFQINFNLNDSI